MPNDVFPKSILPSPILDRFRLLLKDKEDQLGVSGHEFNNDDFIPIYEDVLSELTINSKPLITDLTIIAGDFRDYAEGIAHAICSRVLEVPVEQKMPCLYLLDSIVKNIGRDYVRHFASYLFEVFCEVYRQVPPNLHSSMHRLFGTWAAVFPPSVLSQIEDELQLSSCGNQPSPVLTSARASESPRPSHGIHVNPEYLKARSQNDNVSAKNNVHLKGGVRDLKLQSHKDYVGYEDYDNDQGEDSNARRFYSTGNGGRVSYPPAVNKLLPSTSGSGRPISPSVGDITVSNSPGRMFERASRGRVRRRDGEVFDLQKRQRSGDFIRGPENGFDRNRPRALIDAYGHDDGQRSLDKRPIQLDHQFLNGAPTKAADNSWKNTEEEDFDWEDMSPTLADRRTSNFTQSSIPSTMDFRDRPSVDPFASSRNFDHRSRSNWGNSKQILKTEDSQYAFKDAIRIQDGAQKIPGMLAASAQKLPLSGREHNSQLHINGASSDVYHLKADHFPISMRAPSPESTGLRPPTSFQDMNSGFTFLNQGPQQFENDSTGNSFSMNSAQPIQPGYVPRHHQSRPPVFLPSRLPLSQEPQRNVGYSQRGQIAAPGNICNNPSPAYSNPLLQITPNNSMQFRGPLPPMASGPRLYSPLLPAPRSSGPIANQPNSDKISSLLNSGLINSLVAQGLLPVMKQSSEEDSIGMQFDPDNLKLRHESAIRALYVDLPRQCTTCGLRFKTQDEHSKHMDWHVTKNRISKNRKHNPSRKWFVSVSMWLSGTEALGVDGTPGFLPSETVVENKDDEEEMAVPADEDQTACALCGEPFEDFYSDEAEEWMYRGAVYMNTPHSGTVLGMDRSQLGPIVHAKCRSDTTAAPA